jgi:hypothetical protein
MTRSVFRKPARSAMVATLTAALALTPLTASPAQAGTEDKVGAIAIASVLALFTAGIIAKAASQRDTTPDRHTQPGRHDPPWHSGEPDRPPRTDPRKLLPAQCGFTVAYGRDRGSYYGSQCLQRNFTHWPFLPDRCEERVEGRGRHDVKAYDATCLARYGYSEGRPPRSTRR